MRRRIKLETRILDELDLHGIGAGCTPAVNVQHERRMQAKRDGFTFDETTVSRDRLVIYGDDIGKLLAVLRRFRRMEKAQPKVIERAVKKALADAEQRTYERSMSSFAARAGR